MAIVRNRFGFCFFLSFWDGFGNQTYDLCRMEDSASFDGQVYQLPNDALELNDRSNKKKFKKWRNQKNHWSNLSPVTRVCSGRPIKKKKHIYTKKENALHS